MSHRVFYINSHRMLTFLSQESALKLLSPTQLYSFWILRRSIYMCLVHSQLGYGRCSNDCWNHYNFNFICYFYEKRHYDDGWWDLLLCVCCPKSDCVFNLLAYAGLVALTACRSTDSSLRYIFGLWRVTSCRWTLKWTRVWWLHYRGANNLHRRNYDIPWVVKTIWRQ